MEKKIITSYISNNIPIENVRIGLPVYDDYGNVIGKVIEYYPDTGRLSIEVDGSYEGPVPDLTHIITSRGL